MAETATGREQPFRFRDREEAGRQLAARLEGYRDANPLVLALPRGGVAVAYEVARQLEAPLDVFIARKIGAPGYPELAVGAVAPGGVCVLDEPSIRALGIGRASLERAALEAMSELDRRLHHYRGTRPLPELAHRTVILVDDGLATGLTARAAVRALQRMQPRQLVLAVPVCSREAAATLRPEVDDLVYVMAPQPFHAVGVWYDQFDQVSDRQVLNLLERAGHVAPAPAAAPSATGEPVAVRSGGATACREEPVRIPVRGGFIEGMLTLPMHACGLVLFAHGSGSSRHSPRNQFVAGALQQAGLATLLVDLLTPREEAVDRASGQLRFNIRFLAERLGSVIQWLAQHPAAGGLSLGLFGASTGAAAALVAAAGLPDRVRAVVSRGGRPDLAAPVLGEVQAPTLLIVGGNDPQVLDLNRAALERLPTDRKQLVVVPRATHLFEEPGALEEVARLAAEWFTRHLNSGAASAPTATERGRHAA